MFEISYKNLNGSQHLNKKSLSYMIFGLCVGFSLAYFIVFNSTSHLHYAKYMQLIDNTINSTHVPITEYPESNTSDDGNIPTDIRSADNMSASEDHSLANRLYREVRVLCWIMTSPDNHEKVKQVIDTWGTRCNKLLVMSSINETAETAIALPVGEGRNNLWSKTKEAFKYIYKNHMQEADWFLKADDDTFVIVENLRYLLYSYYPEAPIYFGCKFKPYVKNGYMSGGAGYVLSKEALRRFIEIALPDAKLCRSNNEGSEDVEMGKCLANVGVIAGDSRDPKGRGRFFPFNYETHLFSNTMGKDFWYWSYQYYKSDEGLNCCSDNAISFHYISPSQMQILNYLIYHLRPFGVVTFPQSLPDKIPIEQIKSTVFKPANENFIGVKNEDQNQIPNVTISTNLNIVK